MFIKMSSHPVSSSSSYLYIRIYILIFILLYTYLYIHTYTQIYIYLYIYTYMCTYFYIFIYIHVYIYIYIYTYIHKYIHTYICRINQSIYLLTRPTIHMARSIYMYTEPFTWLGMYPGKVSAKLNGKRAAHTVQILNK